MTPAESILRNRKTGEQWTVTHNDYGYALTKPHGFETAKNPASFFRLPENTEQKEPIIQKDQKDEARLENNRSKKNKGTAMLKHSGRARNLPSLVSLANILLLLSYQLVPSAARFMQPKHDLIFNEGAPPDSFTICYNKFGPQHYNCVEGYLTTQNATAYEHLSTISRWLHVAFGADYSITDNNRNYMAKLSACLPIYAIGNTLISVIEKLNISITELQNTHSKCFSHFQWPGPRAAMRDTQYIILDIISYHIPEKMCTQYRYELEETMMFICGNLAPDLIYDHELARFDNAFNTGKTKNVETTHNIANNPASSCNIATETTSYSNLLLSCGLSILSALAGLCLSKRCNNPAPSNTARNNSWKQAFLEKAKSYLATTPLPAEEKIDDSIVPAEMKCPILHTIMHEPVTLAGGRSFEKSALLKWFVARIEQQQPVTNPLTNEIFDSEPQMISNINLKNLIEEFLNNKGYAPVDLNLTKTQENSAAENNNNNLRQRIL